MALRARAHTIANLDNLLGNENKVAPGKQFVKPNQPAKPTRAALGDIRNKARNASAPTDQKKDEKAMVKPRAKKITPPPKEIIEEKVEVKESMDISAVNEMDIDIEDIDKEDVCNPQLVVEYVQDIYKYLRFLEKEQDVAHDYLAGQAVIMPKMRSVLVDWLVGVHLQFKLLPETVYTTVAILDRYMQNNVTAVSRNTLQLVGVAAMLVASKYEEIYAPEVKDFVYITDRAYTEKDIMKMELNILHGLEFNLGRPLPLHFLRRASKAGGVEAITHTLAKYIMELSLGEYSLVGEAPSRLAAAALALSIRVLEPGTTSMAEVWTRVLEHYTMYKLEDLRPTIQKLASVLLAAPNAKLSSIFNKYSNRKFLKIARIPALDDPLLKDIAAGTIH